MSVTSSYSGSPSSSPRVSVGLGSTSTRALAVVTNKWYREQRRAELDVTRSLTLLKQRKISCILKVNKYTSYSRNYDLDFYKTCILKSISRSNKHTHTQTIAHCRYPHRLPLIFIKINTSSSLLPTSYSEFPAPNLLNLDSNSLITTLNSNPLYSVLLQVPPKGTEFLSQP